MSTPEREKISEGIINIFRGVTRPFLTFYLTVHWSMLLWNVMEAGGSFGDIDGRYTGLVFGLILWWFGDRTLLKGKSLVNVIKGDKK